MAVTINRSPRYPVIGLPEAIARVTAVYKQDNRNKIPKVLVAQHMGYQGLNGKSLGIISAVSKYGLLEGGVNSMWVTPLAVDIIEREAEDPERIAAIHQAARNVELYNDIDEAFESDTVSDAAIRSYLITKRSFLPDSAERLIRSYRETMHLVDGLPPTYDSAAADDRLVPEVQQLEAQSFSTGSPELGRPVLTATSAGSRRAAFPLTEGEVVITFPAELSPESVSDLQDYINVFMKKARREAGVQ